MMLKRASSNYLQHEPQLMRILPFQLLCFSLAGAISLLLI